MWCIVRIDLISILPRVHFGLNDHREDAPIFLPRFSTLPKNNDAPIVAFEDIPTDTELYPCVTFYSSSPGEKVRITSMVMQGAQRDLGNFYQNIYYLVVFQR